MRPKSTPRTLLTFALALSAPALLSLSGGACGRESLDEQAASEAVDSTELTAHEAAMLVGGVEDDSSTLTAADLAAAAKARGAARFQPAGCATVTVDGMTVTYVLAGCTGRFGLAHVTGTLVFTLSDAADGIHIVGTGQGLQVNRATLDLNATAVLTDDAGKRKLVVTTHGSGTGGRGNSFTRDGSYTALRDPATQCIALDGQWQLQVGNASRTTTVTGIERCDGMCPAAGGLIQHTGFRGRTITLTLDGTAVAQWQSSSGKSGTIDLACGG
jgi:hypothetical protein